MKTLKFEIDIDANRQKVWDTMLNPETYKQWVAVSWPGAYYEGEWKQGQTLRFLSPGAGGTMATQVEYKPYERIQIKHIAVIKSDGSEDRDSDIAKGWIGTTETYMFTEKNGKTQLRVQMETSPDWEDEFTNGWPNALAKLKELCES